MIEYKINEKVLKDVINYLASRPFAEVAGLIPALQQSKRIEEDKVLEVKKDTKAKK